MLSHGLAETLFLRKLFNILERSTMSCSEELQHYQYCFYTNDFYTATESLITSTEHTSTQSWSSEVGITRIQCLQTTKLWLNLNFSGSNTHQKYLLVLHASFLWIMWLLFQSAPFTYVFLSNIYCPHRFFKGADKLSDEVSRKQGTLTLWW